ncbi:MAG: hypothetical protein IJP67_07005 [Oscillospiraceae bacterium]|nr:hypothetical protein [Oscillospiraceae bacterium]
MSFCKGCGAPIDWVTTAQARKMPVDEEPVFVIPGDGRDRFVTDEGEVILGRLASPDEEHSPRREVAFVPHWRTCPNADDFRRR